MSSTSSRQRGGAIKDTAAKSAAIDNVPIAYLHSLSVWNSLSSSATATSSSSIELQTHLLPGRPWISDALCDAEDEISMRQFASTASNTIQSMWGTERTTSSKNSATTLDHDVADCWQRANAVRDLLRQCRNARNAADLLLEEDVSEPRSVESYPNGSALACDSAGNSPTVGAPCEGDVDASTTIAAPTVHRPTGSWCGNDLLLDEEDETCEKLSATDEQKNVLEFDCFSATSAAYLTSSSSEHKTKPFLEFLHRFIAALWDADHPDVSFETEAAKTKMVPKLTSESVAFLRSCVSAKANAPHMPLVSKYPTPQFSDSPFCAETNRLMRWLKTWKLSNSAAGDAADSSSDSSDDEDSGGAQRKKENVKKRCRKEREEGTDRFTREVQEVMESGSFLYDERGRRSSARIARKEALERQRELEAEKARQMQRGYFSNDKSTLDDVNASGGEGALTNIAVITGATGIGKTAAAYAAAQAIGYRVVEINTSTRRSTKTLETTIAEATQSKQIVLQAGTATAGRLELEKWKMEAEERRKRLLEQEEAFRQERLRAAAEEAEHQRKAAEAAAAEAKRLAKRAAGVKKENAISKAAVANFFRPKSKPPADAVVHDIDDATTPVVPVVHSLVEDCTVIKSDASVCNQTNDDSRKRERSDVNTTGPSAKSCRASPSGLETDRKLLPLILVESADVAFDDEPTKPFYAAIRAMAAESKFPIIVTANRLSSHDIATHFGANTPRAAMHSPSRMYVVLQLFLVSVAECCELSVDPNEAAAVSVVAVAPMHFNDLTTLAESIVDTAARRSDIRQCLYQLQFQLASFVGQAGGAHVANTCSIDRQENNGNGIPVERCAALSGLLDVLCAVSSQRSAQQSLARAVTHCDNESESDDEHNGGPTTTPEKVDEHRKGGESVAGSTSRNRQHCSATSPSGDVCMPQWSPPTRLLLRDRLVQLLHRTRALAARNHSSRSPTHLSDMVSYAPKILVKPSATGALSM